eukprot:GEMP01040510.1.p1 GENE.GEMP01040510.1~~GEMP01040510.1.p1  ORF type:complete len:488 (+),score=95.83 GEMP01040510.1:252-1715(+)
MIPYPAVDGDTRAQILVEAEAFLHKSSLQKWVTLDTEGLKVDGSLPQERLDDLVELCTIIHWQPRDLYLKAKLGPARLGLLSVQRYFHAQSIAEDLREAIDSKVAAMCASEPADVVLESREVPFSSNTALAVGSRGRGLFAKEDIPAHTDVVMVPEANVFNCYVALLDPVFHDTAIELLRKAQTEEDVVVIYAAYLKGVTSRTGVAHHPAFQFTPMDTSAYTNLLTWPKEALELLQSPQVTGAVEAEHESLHGLSAVLKNLTHAVPYDLDDLVWAICVFHSRAFCVEIPPPNGLDSEALFLLPESNRVTTLVPVADLLNHNYTGQVSTPVFDAAARRLVMRTVAKVGKQCELLLNYGPLQSWEELLYYGFLSVPNVFNSIQLDFEVEDEEGEESDEAVNHAVYQHANSPDVALNGLAKFMDVRESKEMLAELLASMKPSDEAPHDVFDYTEHGQLATVYRQTQRHLLEVNEQQLRKRRKTVDIKLSF